MQNKSLSTIVPSTEKEQTFQHPPFPKPPIDHPGLCDHADVLPLTASRSITQPRIALPKDLHMLHTIASAYIACKPSL